MKCFGEGDSWIKAKTLSSSLRISISEFQVDSNETFLRLLGEAEKWCPENFLLTFLYPSECRLEGLHSGWRKEIADLPILCQGSSRTDVWVRKDFYVEDEEQVEKARRELRERSFGGKDECVIRLADWSREGDLEKVMILLREKFGAGGESWYCPEEISEEFVEKCVFCVCLDTADGKAVGCCGAAPMSMSVFSGERRVGRVHQTDVKEGGWELTHYAVLGTHGGKWAGAAHEMQKVLVEEGLKGGKVLLDATFDRKKQDGGGAWKLGHQKPFKYAGTLFRYTGIVAERQRKSYHDNNHLMIYYID